MIFKKLHSESVLYSKGQASLVNLKDPTLVRISLFGDNYMSSNDSFIFTEIHHNSKVNIGKYVSIATGCQFLLGGNHNYKNTTTYLPLNQKVDESNLYTNGDITIENDVWIGMNCVIMSGVTIGNGSIIAAGSVVTSNVQPYSIVGGNPAKLIKKRFSEEIIGDLINSKWWDLPIEDIKENKYIFSENVVKFIESIK